MPVKNPALLAQIHLSGEVSCPEFTPHMLKANLCTSCSKLISKHSPQAIPDDQCLLKARKIKCTTLEQSSVAHCKGGHSH